MVGGRHLQPRDFRLGAAIGKGTFSVVRIVELRHMAEDNVPVMALKTMKKRDIVVMNQVEHVKSEKELLQMVSSPFVVAFLSAFQDERRIFLLMEYVHGGELYSRLRDEGRLPVDHCKFYAAEMVLALQYLHRCSIVYRDVRPENILLDRAGHIKLCDFGFAKLMQEDLTYTMVGTPEYLAPEIIQSKGHSFPCDCWALAILIFEMMSGYPPFFDASPFGIYSKVLEGALKFPRHFDVKAKHLVRNLLTLEPGRRIKIIDCIIHPWLDLVDWEALMVQKVKAPWRPKVEGPTCHRLYDVIPDDQAEDDYNSALPVLKRHQKLFVGSF